MNTRPTIPRRGLLAVLLLAASATSMHGQEPSSAPERPESPVERLARELQRSVVKIHGASGLATILPYASGVVVSDRGHVLTTDLVMLQKDQTRVVLADGSTHEAKLFPPERDLGVRLLQIDTTAVRTPLVSLRPAAIAPPPSGTFVVSVGNAFRLAEFDEPLSLTFGNVVGTARTGLRHRMAQVDYEGDLVLTDATNNPGHFGGALVTLTGRWVGLNTRVLESTETNTQVSAAVPAPALAAYLARWIDGESAAERSGAAEATEAERAGAVEHGIQLFDEGGRESPPAYVERVRRGSPAAEIRLRPDDLVVQLDEVPIRTCSEFRAFFRATRPGQEVLVTWKRGARILRRKMVLAPRKDDA